MEATWPTRRRKMNRGGFSGRRRENAHDDVPLDWRQARTDTRWTQPSAPKKKSNYMRTNVKRSGALVVLARDKEGYLCVLLVQPRLTYAFRDFVLGWYETPAERSALAKQITPNEAVQLLYGRFDAVHFMFSMRVLPVNMSERTRQRKQLFEKSLADNRVRAEIEQAPFGEVKWSTPRGRIENGETVFDAAVRETYEEAGLHIDQMRWHPGCEYADNYTETNGRYSITYHCAVLTGALPEVSVRSSEQIREVNAVSWTRFANLAAVIEPRQLQIIQKFKTWLKNRKLLPRV